MYYLHHYFNPDFNHKQLKPSEVSQGKVQYHYLGYVQNVVAGQVLAELLPLDEYPEGKRDPRFIYTVSHLPCGPNCDLHPKNPNKIVASVNGYVFYYNGLISVKKLLNIRSHVGFSTGDILFVGDIAVHGDVQTGFSLRAKNIMIKGHIESAKVKAEENIVCLAGVKGSTPAPESSKQATMATEAEVEALPDSLLSAKGDIRLPFCERVQVRARGNLIIDGSCLHSTVYVGGSLVVKGRLQGGSIHANGAIYIEQQLGSDLASPTRIFMGYNPFDMLSLQKLESIVSYLESKLRYYEKMIQRNKVMEQEHQPRYDLVVRKLKIAYSRRSLLWKNLRVDEENACKCKILVPGNIMPGVEISIGQTFYNTTTLTAGKMFVFNGDEIMIRPINEA